MKNKFDWYLKPTDQELDEIWKEGILTVDTNVLLDLYRYHEETRNILIESLHKFEGRKWLSHQAASEFFRNRTKVIVSSEKTFKEAQSEIDKLSNGLSTAVSQLKGNRIIPSEIADELDKSISDAISQANTKIKTARESYPRFLQDDTILAQLTNLFDGVIGEDFTEEEKPELEKIAEERKQKNIPPGYLDDDKDDDRPYGDYYLWRQTLNYAKSEKKPVILVTSERKEDWWEKISGKTTGPRPELLKEAKEVCGQRILIYQTERFLAYAQERLQQPVNTSVIDEIRAVSTWRDQQELAVRLKEQFVSESTTDKNVGTLHVELRRPVRNFTVSGHLKPRFQEVPQLSAKLINAPESLPKHVIRSGTGTTHDFNIHIMSRESVNELPIGTYVFEYVADCEYPSDEGISEGTEQI